MKLDNLLESLVKLDEGASVNSELDTLLKQNGYGDTAEVDNKMLRQALIQAVNALPVVWQSPNGQNRRTGKDALAIMAWFLSQWDGNRSTIQHTFEEVADLVAIKNSLKTTKGKWLADVQNKYKTVPEFRSFIQREQRNKNNTVEDVNVEGYDYPDPFYSDKDVDVYKASTINDAIKYSKGYTFCIGRRDGSNLFYGYRIAANAPESTVYFCWFKDAEGNKTHDDMCVIHVANNGMYRMTDARNSNGSPVVDKDKVLKEYPKLKKALQKMYSEPLDDEEKVVSKVRPFTVIELNDTTRAYTPKQIAMLIGNACRFGDDFFNYVYEELDGKDLENGDSLIRKYLATGANRPTEEQEERLVRDGWGEYVDYNLKQYKKQVGEIQDHLLRNVLGFFTDHSGKKYYMFNTSDASAASNLYKPLDYPLDVGDYDDVNLTGDLWTHETLAQFKVQGGLPIIHIKNCHRLKEFDISCITFPFKQIVFMDCDALSTLDLRKLDNKDSYVSVLRCPKFNSISIDECDRLEVDKCDGIESLRNIRLKGERFRISQCNGLRSLDGISQIDAMVYVDRCVNLSDVSDLGSTPSKIKSFEITGSPSVSVDDFIKYVVPYQEKDTTNPWVSKRSIEARKKDFLDTADLRVVRSTSGVDVYKSGSSRVFYFGPLDKPISATYIDTVDNVTDYSGIYSANDLHIDYNHALTTLETLSDIRHLRKLKIDRATSLVSTRGCPSLEIAIFEGCYNLKELILTNETRTLSILDLRMPYLPNVIDIPDYIDRLNLRDIIIRPGDFERLPNEVLTLEIHCNTSFYLESFEGFHTKCDKLIICDNVVSLKGINEDNAPRLIVIDTGWGKSIDDEELFRVMDLRVSKGGNRMCDVIIADNEEETDKLHERYWKWAKKQHQHK